MGADRMVIMDRLEQRIGYTFRDRSLLTRALTHRSADLGSSGQHMERLEFLGDAVLGLVISEFLHTSFPARPEGELSRMRSLVVSKQGLHTVASAWQLSASLHVGESERCGANGNGIKSRSIIANAVEAIIGAIFEDGGWDAARTVVLRAWQSQLNHIGEVDPRDAKSRLQELTQARGWGLPDYQLLDRGVGISPRFSARCRVRGEVVGEGSGERKKLAEIEAAEQACCALRKES